MWWLILCVTLNDHRVSRLNIFLGVSVRVFHDEISIWISWLNRLLSLVGVSIIQSNEDLNRKKDGRKWNLFLPPHPGFFSYWLQWTSHPIFPYPQLRFIPSGLLVLRYLDLDRITPPALLCWVSSFQIADCATSQPP